MFFSWCLSQGLISSNCPNPKEWLSACGFSNIDYNFLISSLETFVYEERRVEMNTIHFKSIYSGSVAPRFQLTAICLMSAEQSQRKRFTGRKEKERLKEEREREGGMPRVFWLNTSSQCGPTPQLTCVRRFLNKTFVRKKAVSCI